MATLRLSSLMCKMRIMAIDLPFSQVVVRKNKVLDKIVCSYCNARILHYYNNILCHDIFIVLC